MEMTAHACQDIRVLPRLTGLHTHVPVTIVSTDLYHFEQHCQVLGV